MSKEIEIAVYEASLNKSPYLQWEAKLPIHMRALITARIGRLRLGNFGDCKSIKGAQGIYELKVHHGPGFRIYFTKYKNSIVILLCAGDKKSQTKDIKRAKEYLEDFLKSEGRKRL